MKSFDYMHISYEVRDGRAVWISRVFYIAACGSRDTLWAGGDTFEEAGRAGMEAYDNEPDHLPLWGSEDLECVDNFAAYHG